MYNFLLYVGVGVEMGGDSRNCKGRVGVGGGRRNFNLGGCYAYSTNGFHDISYEFFCKENWEGETNNVSCV